MRIKNLSFAIATLSSTAIADDFVAPTARVGQINFGTENFQNSLNDGLSQGTTYGSLIPDAPPLLEPNAYIAETSPNFVDTASNIYTTNYTQTNTNNGDLLTNNPYQYEKTAETLTNSPVTEQIELAAQPQYAATANANFADGAEIPVSDTETTNFVDTVDAIPPEAIQNNTAAPAVNTDLGVIRVTGEQKKDINDAYQTKISEKEIRSRPAGNSDITSLLRTKAVQISRTATTSENMGDISPLEVSIAGGQVYQNAFLIDGININNNIDPSGSGSWPGRPEGRSQGVNIDTSLIKSVTMQDSNISAKYSGFNGGVIEAETKRPEKDLSVTVKHRYTNGNAERGFPASLTSYHIYDEDGEREEFLNSTAADGKHPAFIKNFTTITAESKVSDKLGVIGQFTRNQSVKPMTLGVDEYYKTYNGGAWATTVDHENVKKKSKQYVYNAFAKVYYDPSEDLNLELSYTYAPDYDRTFIEGAKAEDFYDKKHGGHILNQKTTWNNDVGKLTSQTAISKLQDRTVSHGNTNIKYWAVSDNKNWSNWAAWAREGTYSPSTQNQFSINQKIGQEFNPFKVGITEHKVEIGAELDHKKYDFQYDQDLWQSVKAQKPMTKEQQQLCLQTDQSWCDPSKAYDPRKFSAMKDYPEGTIVEEDRGTKTIQVWPYGQYIGTAYFYKGNEKVRLSENKLNFYLQDEITLPSEKFGELKIRPGINIGYSNFLKKWEPAHRFTVDYGLPYNKDNPEWATHITGGINRYVGSTTMFGTIFDRRINSLNTDVRRSGPEKDWEEIKQQDYVCKYKGSAAKGYKHVDHQKAKEAGMDGKSLKELGGENAVSDDLWVEGNDTDCVIHYENSDEQASQFEHLKAPYSDEFTGGFTQQMGPVLLTANYIHRNYRDDIRMGYTDELGLTDPSDTYYRVITNNGHYKVDQVNVNIKNTEPLKWKNTEHSFAFDYTWQKKKGNIGKYNTYLRETDDDFVLYDGDLIPKSKMPQSDYAQPYKIALTTNSEWNMLGGKYHIGNVFQFRRSYEEYASDNKLRTTPTKIGIEQPSGSSIVYYYRKFRVPSKFSWDMKFGGEYTVNKERDSAVFFDFDVTNILNKKSAAVVSYNNSKEAAVPTYDPGRQIWLEFGYRF
ncbi:MAG: TonB-dependent receptor plug domain-containing protein [Cardiobacteriaceae bacterium]|nr:TonB-dependent receptor plug domain-containing protein [Cardiobacteriaceae bacterium]